MHEQFVFDTGPEGAHGALGGQWQSYKALRAQELPLVSPVNSSSITMAPVHPKGSPKPTGIASTAEPP